MDYSSSILSEIHDYLQTISTKLTCKTWICKKSKNKLKWKIPLSKIENFLIILYFSLKLNNNNNNDNINKPIMNKLQVCAVFCHLNFDPIHITSEYMIQVLLRFFMKINSLHKIGFFIITIDGIIKFKVNTHSILDLNALHKENFKRNMFLLVNTIDNVFKVYGPRIILLSGLIKQKNYSSLIAKYPYSKSLYQFNEELTRYFAEIITFLRKSNEQNPDPQEMKQADISRMTDICKTKIMAQIEPSKREAFIKDETLIKNGTFSMIYRALVHFIILNQDNLGYFASTKGKELKKLMIIKRKKKNVTNEYMKNEKELLKQIKEFSSPYLPRYFEPNISNNDSIYMEYYQHDTLGKFIKEHSHIGLMSKLWFLDQIANGLIFLEKQEILYQNLKPEDTVITRNFICKLIDFGKSHLNKGKKSKIKPIKIYPYVCPELCQDNIEFNYKMDAFSFGILICDIIFDQKIFDYPIYSLSQDFQKNFPHRQNNFFFLFK